MFRRTILAVLALATAAAAQAQPVDVKYAAYNTGLHVIDLEAHIAISPDAYRIDVAYHLTGVVGAIIHGDSKTTVDGRFDRGEAEPRELFSTGHLRGQPRVTQIDWRDGNPVISQLQPPVETERDPVPADAQAHTIDTLSAMATLIYKVSTTGRCEGATHTFDGRRLAEISAHTVGEEVLPQTDRSSFHGTALRCDFDGRQLAGFVKDEDQAALRRPQHGSAWFARLTPGGPIVPVRMMFETRLFGPATMYMTAAG